MSEQVQVAVNQDDLAEEVTEDLLLTKGEDIYEIMEGHGDVHISSKSDTGINTVSFVNRPHVCCVDLVQYDQMTELFNHEGMKVLGI